MEGEWSARGSWEPILPAVSCWQAFSLALSLAATALVVVLGGWGVPTGIAAEVGVVVDSDKSASISGFVLDEFDNPIGGVPVEYWNEASGEFDSTTTDTDGSFSLNGLPPGYFELYALPAVASGLTRSQDAWWHLAAEETRTGVILRVEHGARVWGYVSLATGFPVVGLIEVVGKPGCHFRALPDAWAYYEMRLAPGTYSLGLWGDYHSLVDRDVVITSAFGFSLLRNFTAIPADSTPVISGEVTPSSPVEALAVAAIASPAPMDVDDAVRFKPESQSNVLPAAGGDYEITGLPTGYLYDLLCLALRVPDDPEDFDFLVILASSQDVPPGTTHEDFAPDTTGATLRGLVTDAETGNVVVEKARFILADSSTGEFVARAVSNALGRWMMRPIPAGDYTLSIFTRTYETYTTSVHVVDTGEIVCDAALIPLGAPTWELTMAAAPAAGGATTPVVGTHTVLAEAPQAIEALPAAAFVFSGWTASPSANAAFGNAADASTTVTLMGDATVTANFTRVLRLRVTGITWSADCTTATVDYEANQPVQRYYYRMYQTQPDYTSTAGTSAMFGGLGTGYYLFVVSARDTHGDFAPTPCRVWFYNKPAGATYQVSLSSYTIDDDEATFALQSNQATELYYARLYDLETTYTAYEPGVAVTYTDLAEGMHYFVATGRDAATLNFPPGGPARQFIYIDTAGF